MIHVKMSHPTVNIFTKGLQDIGIPIVRRYTSSVKSDTAGTVNVNHENDNIAKEAKTKCRKELKIMSNRLDLFSRSNPRSPSVKESKQTIIKQKVKTNKKETNTPDHKVKYNKCLRKKKSRELWPLSEKYDCEEHNPSVSGERASPDELFEIHKHKSKVKLDEKVNCDQQYRMDKCETHADECGNPVECRVQKENENLSEFIEKSTNRRIIVCRECKYSLNGLDYLNVKGTSASTSECDKCYVLNSLNDTQNNHTAQNPIRKYFVRCDKYLDNAYDSENDYSVVEYDVSDEEIDIRTFLSQEDITTLPPLM